MIPIYPLTGNRIGRQVPVLVLTTLSILIASCTTSVEMIKGQLKGKVQIAQPLNVFSGISNPLDFDNGIVKTVPTNDRGVVIATHGDRISFHLTRFDSLLNMVWETRIPQMAPNEKYAYLFYRDTLVTLFSFESRDSMLLSVRRVFDAADGRPVAEAVVDTVVLEYGWRSKNGYQVFCSPDSTKLLISIWNARASIWAGEMDDDAVQKLHNTVLDSKSMHSIGNVVWQIGGRERITSRQVDNHGNTYVVSIADKKTITGVMYQADGDEKFHVLRAVIPDPEDDFEARTALASVQAVGRLNVAVSLYDGWSGELAGIGTVQFDFTTAAALASLIYLPPLMEKLIDDDECDNCHIVGLHPTLEAMGSLVILERRWTRSGGINIGEIVLLHLDSTLRLRWGSGIIKEDSKIGMGFAYLGLVAHLIDQTTIRIIYMADPELIMREYSIADGTELTPKDGERLVNCNSAVYLRSYTTTTVDHDLVFIVLQGGLDATYLYKVSP